jgi:basic amino acid/polyamine antiporter, APA family
MWQKLFRRKDIESIRRELREVELGPESGRLTKNLTLFDLVCFGIAAIIGAGIFSTIGSAAAEGGPAVSVLFVITAITCLFSALCYAEFAARIPVSGSAYTYSYAAFGELVAWIIGWDLLMEYSIGNSTIAFSWSEYFSTLLQGLRIDLPNWLETDYYSCARAIEAHVDAASKVDLPQLLAAAREVQAAVSSGMSANAVAALDASATLQAATDAGLEPTKLLAQETLVTIWNTAPNLGGLKTILDMPAMAINIFVTCLVYIGIKESKTASNMMVMLKIAVVLIVIAVGVFYVKPENWSPFAPNGVSGMLKGIAAVFFAFIGFDAISTTAEECNNPQRDLPRATILVLIICTVLYVAIAFVLTGMVSYSELAVGDPLAFVFQKYNLNWMAGLISLSAIVAITSVFLVFQIGQPRIWMSMSRDGLLPKKFSSIHPKYKTPAFSTVVTGLVVALPIVFLNQQVVTDLCSIGTLFAFMLVSAGVLTLEIKRGVGEETAFRVPYISGRWFVLVTWAIYTVAMAGWLEAQYGFALPKNHNAFNELTYEKLPYIFFYVALSGLAVATFIWRWSLIPVFGVLTNLYLIAGLGHHNWVRFFAWLAIGLVIYFGYGFWNSRLNQSKVI